MRIHRLSLKNFRCFEDRAFDLGPRLTLFIGNNGEGKTAVLDALAVGAGAWFLGFPGVPARSIRREDVRRASYLMADVPTLEPQTPCTVSCAGEMEGQWIEWARTLHSLVGRTDRCESRSITELSRETAGEVQAGGRRTLPVISYYGTCRLCLQRRQREVPALRRGSRLRGYADCLTPVSDAKRLVSWFKTYEFSARQREQAIGSLEGVRAAVLACIPGARRLYYDPLGEDDLMLEFDSWRLPFHLLSDGYRSVLGTVADIAWRAATLNPHLGEAAVRESPGIVLIDELDLHLHPKWQRVVVEHLMEAFPKVQFVGTTHSPFIIQSIERREGVTLVNLDGLDTHVASRSIEEIAEENQGVEGVARSERFHEMLRAAEEYYRVTGEARAASSDQVELLKRRLDDLLEPYAEDPAYAALLRMERAAVGLDGESNAAR